MRRGKPGLALFLGVLVSGLVLLTAGPARAANSLTVSPTHGSSGSKVNLTYTLDAGQNQCPQGVEAHYFLDQQAIGTKSIDVQTCRAALSYTTPKALSCGTHTFTADAEYPQNQGTIPGSGASATYTVTCATKKPTPTPTTAKPNPKPSATSQQPRPTQTARPTQTQTQAPQTTPSARPTPAHSSTAAPVTVPSGAPTFGPPPPPSDGGGGSSSTVPWFVGGGLLALAGLGLGVGVLAPRGAGKPAVAGVVAVGLLGGGALAAVPVLSPPVDPAFRTSYASSGDCSTGDIPIFGGYHAFDVRPTLYHFHPEETSWNAAPEGSVNEGNPVPGGPSYTLCLRVGRSIPHAVRERSVPSSAPAGSSACQVGESLLGGGFYYPWGTGELVGSHPEAPARWAAADTRAPDDLASLNGHVYALCAELPDGVHTYATSASGGAGGTATAHCFSGDAVLGGGWTGRGVRGSFPVEGGWTAELGEAGSAYALCYKPSRAFGLRASYVRSATESGDVDVSASCDGSDAVLGAGWVGGHGLTSLRHFEPTEHGWGVNLVQEDGNTATAFVLCARPYVK